MDVVDFWTRTAAAARRDDDKAGRRTWGTCGGIRSGREKCVLSYSVVSMHEILDSFFLKHLPLLELELSSSPLWQQVSSCSLSAWTHASGWKPGVWGMPEKWGGCGLFWTLVLSLSCHRSRYWLSGRFYNIGAHSRSLGCSNTEVGPTGRKASVEAGLSNGSSILRW